MLQVNLKDIYQKSDVFALGQVFYSILTKSKSECFYANRLRSPGAKLPTLPSSLPAALCHVIGQMTSENPARRLTAKQAMQRYTFQTADHNSLVIKRSFFLPKQSQNLDPSCKTDLDPWDCLGRVKLVL